MKPKQTPRSSPRIGRRPRAVVCPGPLLAQASPESSGRLRRQIRLTLLAGGLALAWAIVGPARAAGPLVRAANTTLRLPSEPPRFGFRTEPALGNLTFTNPVAIASPPGETNRLFVVEQAGRILVVTNLAQPTRTVFLDIRDRVTGGVPIDERGLLGLAFHPDYARNRYFYVFYTRLATTEAGSGLHDRLSRFETSPDDPNAALPNSEVPLITQRDEANNHNGGDLHFGPDGYLYVSLGDEGGGNDFYGNSQRIDRDFFAGILRIDVDQRPGSLPPNLHPAASIHYAVPPDNPFVGAISFNGVAVDPAQVRTEFWAVGLRNPWRFSFDPASGRLYCGDVGQDAIEEIDLIVKGGNYGWNYFEGTRPGPRRAPADFTSVPPLLQYPHGNGPQQGNSVTGGVVYRGTRLAQLFGAYVFADYVSGNIWALWHEGDRVIAWERLAVDSGVAGFGVDPRNGDVLLADQTEDLIKRLVYQATPTGEPLPATLADTGAFVDLASLTPHAGIVPYELNVPFWSDHAHKTRWFSVPDPAQTIGFNPTGSWTFPSGTVWIKQFELELTNGVPASRRRLETRFLVKNNTGVYGITYRWNDAQTNAELVPEEGLDERFVIHDNGVTRTQVWHYPSRAECLTCHTAVGGGALGFNTAQLNRLFDYGGVEANQIEALAQAGYFASAPERLYTLPALAPADDPSISREWRVRSYLAANCAQCHQPGGPALGFWDARLQTPTALAGLIDGRLRDPHDEAHRVLAPGSLERSDLYHRLAELGPAHMPPLATSVINEQALQLLAAWITEDLPAYRTFAQWQQEQFGSTSAPDAAPEADPDGDGAPNQLEFLLGTDPRQPGQTLRVSATPQGDTIALEFPQAPNRGYEVLVADTLTEPAVWRPLEAPGNRPTFAATPRTGRVLAPIDAAQSRYYRVRVFAP